jgi:lysophospholipase L1-like esterase
VQRGDQSPGPSQQGELERFKRVRELVNGIGVPWIDAGAVITDLEADAAKGDGSHFSPAGCERIGEAIARTLEPLLRSRAHRSPGPG